MPVYHFECLDFPAAERPMNSYYVEFDAAPHSSAPPHQHAGVELIYLLRGRLAVSFDANDVVVEILEAGDSMYFDADRPHSYRRQGGEPCAAVVVTAA
jgi:quercetin dioxygenase-like cupin family protein